MTDLSILIPARNEMFLARTIEDILANMRGDTEVIAILDGAWADPPIKDHPKVTLVYHSQSIGQRAATNEAAKLSQAKYVMKVDAHCGFALGFDTVLLNDMQDDFVVAPLMKNLHAFDFVCKKCGWRRYQGPTPPACEDCGNTDLERDIVWISKPSPNSTAYRVDTALHFQYWGGFKKQQDGQGDLTETMSLQGSCFMVSREKFFELNLCDESWGSWGQQGCEVALKAWLAGCRVMVNQRTFYSHMFRTSGGDFGFPYPLGGKDVERARNKSRDIFFNNKYEKQIYPLSWLIEKFAPIPDWHEELGRAVLEQIMAAGIAFTNLHSKSFGVLGIVTPVPNLMADHAAPMPIDSRRQEVAVPAMSLPSFVSSNTIPLKDIVPVSSESQMTGVTTKSVVTDMIGDGDISALPIGDWGNEPSIDESVDSISNLIDTNISITIGSSPVPNPTIAHRVDGIDLDFSKKTRNSLRGKVIDDEHIIHTQIVSLNKGILYYTDNRLDERIMTTCQQQLLNSVNSHRIVSVSLKPIDFGENIHLPLERGYLTMFKQILAGLEALDTDIVYFCEHDCLYHPSHFEFMPPRKDAFYYNVHVWKVRAEDGHALFCDHMIQTSGLCAYRELLVEHYRKRVAKVEQDGKYDRNTGFEPGTHSPPRGIDNYPALFWKSEYPNIDIRHDRNLTKNRWRKDQFRNQKYTEGWIEAEEVPGWGKIEQFLEMR